MMRLKLVICHDSRKPRRRGGLKVCGGPSEAGAFVDFGERFAGFRASVIVGPFRGLDRMGRVREKS